MRNKLFVLFICLFIFLFSGHSQEINLTVKKDIPATPVKNQDQSATCWSFAGLSLLESELIREHQEEYDLSEMFIVKYAYLNKARKYIRMHGTIKFPSGGEMNDVLDVIDEHGIVPEAVYTGQKLEDQRHIHGEMDEVLQNYVDAVLNNYKKNKQANNNKITPVWDEGFDLVLNAYMGRIPSRFDFNKESLTPLSFSGKLDINSKDYVFLSSWTHHPFYEPFILEVPDNWSWGRYYNIPLNDLKSLLYHALEHDYSIGLAIDVSDDGFNWDQGFATLNDSSINVDQNMRQQHFDSFLTTDDHGMHITGWAEDEEGKKYFKVKNSWGTSNPFDGYIYISEPYLLLKATSIVLHRDGVPTDIREKIRGKNFFSGQ